MKSQTTASSVSSRRFNLDENDTSDIFVYIMRHGYQITSQKKLCKYLDTHPRLCCSRKSIPRGFARLEVIANDLFNEPERTKYRNKPNARCSMASVGLPRKVFWRRLMMGHFPNLYIISPDHSPPSSKEPSQNPSPTATFAPNQEFSPEPKAENELKDLENLLKSS